MYHSSFVRRHGIHPDLGRRLHPFSGRQTQVGRGTGYMCAAGYNSMYKSHTISIVTATNYIPTDVSGWVESLESCDCHRSFISSYVSSHGGMSGWCWVTSPLLFYGNENCLSPSI